MDNNFEYFQLMQRSLSCKFGPHRVIYMFAAGQNSDCVQKHLN